MGKRSRSKKGATVELACLGEPLAELRFTEPLFQMALHPTKPIILSGLATGFVYCHSYDAGKLQETVNENKKKVIVEGENKPFWTSIDVEKQETTDAITLMWRTRRHKGSVRCLCLDPEGEYVYSVGTDNVLKKAVTGTGKVVKKTSFKDQKLKFTKMIRSPTHAYLLLGDEDGNVMVLNSDTLELTNKVHKIHGGDAINDIFQFAKRSVHKYISVGQTTMGYWDARESNESDLQIPDDDEDAKRKVLLSDDQEDEILCGTFVDPEAGDTIVCGMGEGVLTVWKPQKNDLEDQVNRIKICPNESIDCIVPTLQDDNGVWCGGSSGNLYRADVKGGRVVEVRRHSDIDEVTFLDLDYEYRVVSGGMDKIVLWHSVSEDEDQKENESSDEDQSNEEEIEVDTSDDESASDDSDIMVGLSRVELIAELDKDLQGSSEEEEEKKEKPKNKKRRVPGKLAASHGITKFEGL